MSDSTRDLARAYLIATGRAGGLPEKYIQLDPCGAFVSTLAERWIFACLGERCPLRQRELCPVSEEGWVR